VITPMARKRMPMRSDAPPVKTKSSHTHGFTGRVISRSSPAGLRTRSVFEAPSSVCRPGPVV
jgi:hypothetical protein